MIFSGRLKKILGGGVGEKFSGGLRNFRGGGENFFLLGG